MGGRHGPELGEGEEVRRKTDVVDHPPHYGGADNPYEAIKIIDAWGLGFALGNALKYVCRAGKKHARGAERSTVRATLVDLKKAAWYLNHEIKKLEKLDA